MLLSCRTLENVNSANDFDYTTQISFTAGDAIDVYIQLIDMNKDKSLGGFHPSGRRYMPKASSTLSVVVDCIDTAKKLTRTASQPFPLDPSIWKFSILSTDTLRGTATLRLTLVEPGSPSVTIRGSARNAISINPSGAI